MCIYCQVVAIVSCLFVVVSTLCLIFSTLPAFHVKDESGKISRKLSILSNNLESKMCYCFRGGILFWSCWSSICWMVFIWIRHQICCSTSEVTVRIIINLHLKISMEGNIDLTKNKGLITRNHCACKWNTLNEIYYLCCNCCTTLFLDLWREQWTLLTFLVSCLTSCLFFCL